MIHSKFSFSFKFCNFVECIGSPVVQEKSREDQEELPLSENEKPTRESSTEQNASDSDKENADAKNYAMSDGAKKNGKSLRIRKTSSVNSSSEVQEEKHGDIHLEAKAAKRKSGPLYLFKTSAVWAIVLGHVAHNYCRHTFSWLPTYFDEVIIIIFM